MSCLQIINIFHCTPPFLAKRSDLELGFCLYWVIKGHIYSKKSFSFFFSCFKIVLILERQWHPLKSLGPKDRWIMCLSFSKAMTQMMDLWLNLQLGFTFPVNRKHELSPPGFPHPSCSHLGSPDFSSWVAPPDWSDVDLTCVPVFRVSAGCFNCGKG